jgi:hypothetical protein
MNNVNIPFNCLWHIHLLAGICTINIRRHISFYFTSISTDAILNLALFECVCVCVCVFFTYAISYTA